jgi:hypothetical protein
MIKFCFLGHFKKYFKWQMEEVAVLSSLFSDDDAEDEDIALVDENSQNDFEDTNDLDVKDYFDRVQDTVSEVEEHSNKMSKDDSPLSEAEVLRRRVCLRFRRLLIHILFLLIGACRFLTGF